VRRERRWATAREKTRPETGSLYPAAIGAAAYDGEIQDGRVSNLTVFTQDVRGVEFQKTY
jgi:hypothetical protein